MNSNWKQFWNDFLNDLEDVICACFSNPLTFFITIIIALIIIVVSGGIYYVR